MAREIEYVAPHDLVIIGLDTDHRGEHPLFDERVFIPIDTNLVKNITVYGIQQPVLARQEAGKYYVVDGRQRVRAAREAVKAQGSAGEFQVKVPVRVLKADDRRVSGIMISANEHRQGDEVLSKAFKAVRLMDLVGDINTVSIAFGRSEAQIRNWFTLAEADSSLHSAIRLGTVGASAAIEIARLPREEQVKAVEKLVEAGGGKSVSEAQARQYRQDTGNSTGTAKSTATAASRKVAGKAANKSRGQAGIKRTWLRRALKTKAAKTLTDEQKAVLVWMSNGESEKGTWFDDFRCEAEVEMEKK